MTSPGALAELADLVAGGGVVVLSGAGVSTASGIPDYRGVTGRSRTRAPMTWAEFDGSDAARRRYWAGAAVAAHRFVGVAPNVAHRAVAALEESGHVDAVVTQNVDGLHQDAGSRTVTELHGALRTISCTGCGARTDRASVVTRLHAANPWLADQTARVQADGDAAVTEAAAARLRQVDCADCGGRLRPDVVFFGELVPREVMARARGQVAAARTLLVLGSSLTVGSGRLLLRHARREGAATAIVNIGPTRGDAEADVRLEADVVDVLPELARRLSGAAPGGADGRTDGD